MAADSAEARPATDRELVDYEFPYDRAAVAYELRGIDKLRAEPDRELAAVLYRGWKTHLARTAPVEVLKPRAAEPSEEEWWKK